MKSCLLPADVKCRHMQMSGWVKQRMVPLFNSGGGFSAPESHGCLETIWLGSLVKPRALFTALRQEKAVLTNCLIDEVNNSYELRPAACTVRAAACTVGAAACIVRAAAVW